MINIEEAIKKAKDLDNISNGGSECYDFDDVVLVKYVLSLKYANNRRARENALIVKDKINEKALMGVNTPKHLDILRTVENNKDVCYVLEEKCPGRNCHSLAKYGVSEEQVLTDLKNIYPFKRNGF